MVEVTQALAERVSEVARLLESDDDRDAAMARLTSLGVELVPGATAAHNADLYGASCRVVHNLQMALESRAVIEQAKGVVHAELRVSVDEAFQLLSRASQNTNQKVRDIAAKLVHGEISPRRLRVHRL